MSNNPEKRRDTTVTRAIIKAVYDAATNTWKTAEQRATRLDRVITYASRRITKKYEINGRELADAVSERVQKGIDSIRRLF